MENLRKVSDEENELYQRLDEVLHYIWDPIGVCGVPGARDEYHSYLPPVFNLLKQSSNANEIADYLGRITSERMGLGLNRNHDIEVAEILLDWKATLQSPTVINNKA